MVKSRFFQILKKLGKWIFSFRDGKFRVLNIEINPAYRGKGFARLLLDHLVSYAKANNLVIIPHFCPYVLAKFERNPEEYVDVWLKKGA